MHVTFADEWGLENKPLRYEWGLEEQTLKHEKSDSIVLRYNGEAWEGAILNTNKRLISVCVIDSKKDNVYAVVSSQNYFYTFSKNIISEEQAQG